MTPQEMIAALDRDLQIAGEDVILRKGNTTAGQKTVRAFVRGYKPDELVGGITQADKKVTISPTSLAGFGTVGEIKIVYLGGKARTVQGEPEQVRADNVLVRVNLTVRG